MGKRCKFVTLLLWHGNFNVELWNFLESGMQNTWNLLPKKTGDVYIWVLRGNSSRLIRWSTQNSGDNEEVMGMKEDCSGKKLNQKYRHEVKISRSQAEVALEKKIKSFIAT